jgi:hypothetical protein
MDCTTWKLIFDITQVLITFTEKACHQVRTGNNEGNG